MLIVFLLCFFYFSKIIIINYYEKLAIKIDQKFFHNEEKPFKSERVVHILYALTKLCVSF